MKNTQTTRNICSYANKDMTPCKNPITYGSQHCAAGHPSRTIPHSIPSSLRDALVINQELIDSEHITSLAPAVVSLNTNYGGTVVVTPGVLDEDALFGFSGGQCHAMAIALSERLDKPLLVMVTVGESEDIPSNPDEEWIANHWTHAVVEISTEKYLDVSGVWDEEEVIDNYCRIGEDDLEYSLVPIEREGLENLHNYGKCQAPQTDIARLFVDVVLAESQEFGLDPLY